MTADPAPASAPSIAAAVDAAVVSVAEAGRRETRNRINAAVSAAGDLAAGAGGAADAAAALERAEVFEAIATLSAFEQAGFAKVIAKMCGLPLPDVRKRIAKATPAAATASIREIGERPRVAAAISFSAAAAIAVLLIVEDGAGGERDEVYVAVADGRRRVIARPDEAVRILGVEFSSVPAAVTLAHRWKGWSEWVEGAAAPTWAEVFAEIRRLLAKHVEFVRPVDLDVVAAWTIATYFHPICTGFPFLHFYGDPGSGKSQAAAVLARTAFSAEKIIEISDSQLYRLVEECAPTLVFDEGDRLSAKDKEAQRPLLRGAFDRGNTVILAEVADKEAGTFASRRFSIYSPRAFCTMKEMPLWAMTDRSIRITMLLALGGQGKQPVTDDSGDWWGVRDSLYRLALDRWREFGDEYVRARAAAPANRTGLRWAPLLAIGMLAGEGLEVVNPMLVRMAEDEVEHIGDDPFREALILGLWCLVRGAPAGTVETATEKGERAWRPTWAGAGDAAGADDPVELEPSAIYAAAGAFLPPISVDRKSGEPDAKVVETRRRRFGGILKKLGIRPAVGADGRAKRKRHGRERLKVTTRRHVADLLRRWPDIDPDVPAAGYAADEAPAGGVTEGGDAEDRHPYGGGGGADVGFL